MTVIESNNRQFIFTSRAAARSYRGVGSGGDHFCFLAMVSSYSLLQRLVLMDLSIFNFILTLLKLLKFLGWKLTIFAQLWSSTCRFIFHLVLFLIVDLVTLKMSVLAGLNSSSAMSGPASESVMAMEWGGIAGIELRSSRLRSSSRPAPRGTPPGPRAVSLLQFGRFGQ